LTDFGAARLKANCQRVQANRFYWPPAKYIYLPFAQINSAQVVGLLGKKESRIYYIGGERAHIQFLALETGHRGIK